MTDTRTLLHSAQRTIDLERQAIDSLRARLNGDFTRACELILACKGRVVVVGMGKSGHIGNKIAATLASTGTPAFFVHPAEASHGDMGMITKDDVVLALSNSGSTAEIVTLLPLIKRLGIQLISMTGNPESPLAKAAEVNLDARVAQEARRGDTVLARGRMRIGCVDAGNFRPRRIPNPVMDILPHP